MTTPDPTPLPIALRTREAAAALGISERMLQELASSGEVPVVKIGRANLFPVRELQDWLTSRITATNNIAKAGKK
jgi:excisionase family DNA binding protein